MSRIPIATVVLATALLAGCDMLGGALGIESPEKVAAAREAEGKAVGGACRHAGRAIEDCYTMNKKAEKAAETKKADKPSVAAKDKSKSKPAAKTHAK